MFNFVSKYNEFEVLSLETIEAEQIFSLKNMQSWKVGGIGMC